MVNPLLNRVADYYTSTLKAHGATPQGADWRDAESQELRFAELIKVTRSARQGRLAEVGCGWGAFPLWANREQYSFDYIGYDVSSEMVNAAQNICRDIPNAEFRMGAGPFDPADWVIASGIFNVRFDIPEPAWRSHVDHTIAAMATAARRGFAFNVLTGFSDPDRKESRLFYPDPGEMLSTLMHRYGRHAALFHDTRLYEFTICVWHSL